MTSLNMQNQKNKYAISIVALAAILAAGALYADKVYVSPEAPPNIIQTIKGPVILYEDAEPGELITAPNLGAIYYLNKDRKRVVFPDEQTFNSWYPDFENLKHIPLDVLESYPLSGRNATIRSGTYLITIPSSYQVWMVGYANDLHWLKGGEEQAISLFGENWSERLVDLQEYYFTNYHESWPLEDNNVYPTGLLVHVKSNGQYYVVDGLTQRLVTEDGLKNNNFQIKFAIQRENPLDLELSGPSLDAYEPRWGSPDIGEQISDSGPEEIDVGDEVAEVG